MKKIKGTYGYIDTQKKLVILRTILLYAAAIGIFALGYYTMHTKKSLWTVIAVLGILPASKSAVNMIMFLRFHSLQEEVYQTYRQKAGNLPVLYETVLTTAEKAYYLPMLVCINHTVCGICDVEQSELKKLELHVKNTLEKSDIKNVTIKFYAKEPSFFERLHTLNENFKEQADSDAETIFSIIRTVSL